MNTKDAQNKPPATKWKELKKEEHERKIHHSLTALP
jgi:hypothetical protein